MPQDWILVTGSNGLVGSAVSRLAIERGYGVIGLDNNGRREFFGHAGDTTRMGALLRTTYGPSYCEIDFDVSNSITGPVKHAADKRQVVGIVHAAGQPSHDLAKQMIERDLEVNLLGTLNMLKLNREHFGSVPFVFLSTNKVYGAQPNALRLRELSTRFDFDNEDFDGIDETMSLDQTDHSFFGVSKAAADLLVQEFGRSFDMPTACLRCGCITGGDHAGVELHGFLNYLIGCGLADRPYKIFGYQGKQVRDNIHADDLANLILAIIKQPTKAAVYNVGGGRANSCSILEAAALFEEIAKYPLRLKVEPTARFGDHIVYYTDLKKVRTQYPEWRIRRTLRDIFGEMILNHRR